MIIYFAEKVLMGEPFVVQEFILLSKNKSGGMNIGAIGTRSKMLNSHIWFSRKMGSE